MIKAQIQNMMKPVENAWRFLASIPSQLLATLGLLVLIGTVFAAAWLNDKDLAVAVAFSGAAVGTAFVTRFLPRAIGAGAARRREKELAASARAGQFERGEQERRAIQGKLLEAEREIARLEAMRINLDVLRPILNLGLLEVETRITDFQHRVIGDEEEEGRWRHGHRDAYTGVVQIPIKAHLGVNLQSVRVRETGGRLRISGLVITTVTDTAEGAKWLLDEVRTEYVKGQHIVKFKGDAHDRRAKVFSREHELQVRARLQQGHDFKIFEAGLIRTAEQVLRVLLAPLGKEISFETDAGEDSLELLRYLAEHNQRVVKRIEQVSQGGA